MAPGTLERNSFSWNRRITSFNKARQYAKAMEVFEKMKQEVIATNKYTFVQVVHACGCLKDLAKGKQIHAQIIDAGCEIDTYLGSSLVDMYSKCDSLEDALEVFMHMPIRDVVVWNTMITGCVKCGQSQRALDLYQRMQQEGVIADSITFVGLLKAPANLKALDDGRNFHKQIIDSGFESNVFVGSALVNMYAKFGCIDDALNVFNTMSSRNVVTWNSMILGYAKCGQGQKALALFELMQKEGVVADSGTFVGLLKACAGEADLSEGRSVHNQIIQSGGKIGIHVCNSLVDMYAKCGSLDDAWIIFNEMSKRDVVTWNSMIWGCVKYGQKDKALKLFQQMQLEHIDADSVTFVGLLTACANVQAIDEGLSIHQKIIQSGLESDVFVGSALVDLYARCGRIEDACTVLQQMPKRDVMTWNTWITGCVKSGQGKVALKLYQQMQQEGVVADSFTFVGLLGACAREVALEDGQRVHKQIIQSGCEADIFVRSSLVDMYAKCGSIEDAWRVFKQMPNSNVVIWNAMIMGCVKCGQERAALKLFQQMQQNGVDADSITFVGLINACAALMAFDEGRNFHKLIVQSGCENNICLSSALVDMYAKCGSKKNALTVFQQMSAQNVVTWNSLLMGYVRCGHGQTSLELFRQMVQGGVDPDTLTYVSMLTACASVGALDEGRRFHKEIIQSEYESDIFVSTSLTDMYANCGNIEDARTVFNKMPVRNVVGWNVMIRGYAIHGLAKEALALFEQMCVENLEIDETTFVCLLSACSHDGLVEEGVHLFETMSSTYGIYPTEEHYTCLVDLLGCAGRHFDAEEVIKSMLKPAAGVWMALLRACRVHLNVEVGERAAEKSLELDPACSGACVLLSHIYAAAGLWDRMAISQQKSLEMGTKKLPGRTWIEVDNELHFFAVDDTSHPRILEIQAELKRLEELMKDAGYVPDTRSTMPDPEEYVKASFLCNHSEMLAIAFGLISTPSGASFRIVKNLRVCGDCHSATKFIAKMVGRTIVVRDTNRFHHFQDGLCSCRDNW